MRSFNSFLVENRNVTYNEILKSINDYKKAGEILNPEYQQLTAKARTIFGRAAREGRDHILAVMHSGDRTDAIEELYYAWPSDSFTSLGKFERLLSKVKGAQYKKVIAAAQQLIKDWKPIADGLKELNGKKVKVTQKRAEAKAVAAKAMTKKKGDSAPLVKILQQHIDEYTDAARQRATTFIESKLLELKRADWDLEKLIPTPARNTYDYTTIRQKQALYNNITKTDPKQVHVYGNKKTNIRVVNKEMVTRYIDLAEKGARDSYLAFIEKMISKIGKPVVKAKMTGNIWTNAVIEVVTDDGETQLWNTKMIINFSKYEKMFNQFPSRRKK